MYGVSNRIIKLKEFKKYGNEIPERKMHEP